MRIALLLLACLSLSAQTTQRLPVVCRDNETCTPPPTFVLKACYDTSVPDALRGTFEKTCEAEVRVRPGQTAEQRLLLVSQCIVDKWEERRKRGDCVDVRPAEVPFNVPVRYGGEEKVAGMTFWRWIKAAEAQACSASRARDGAAYQYACATRVGGVLYVTQKFKVVP
jgi:hypothetical protein